MINDHLFEIWIEFQGQEFVYSKLFVFFFLQQDLFTDTKIVHLVALSFNFNLLLKYLTRGSKM